MKDLLIPLALLLPAIARLLGSGDVKAVVADNLLMKRQPLIIIGPGNAHPAETLLTPEIWAVW
jgi:hypothetical protein